MTGPAVAETTAELRKLRAGLPGPVGLVPTMGALHEGHRTLVRAARERCGSVVVSVFVNPTQFGPGEDFDRYPRTWDADLAALAEEGADVVFHPAVEEVYPPGSLGVTVDPGPLGGVLEGAVRPGHFAGVLTVVAKLFGLVRPDAAFFGEKDYQQLTLIRAMARELALGIEVVGVPTVREGDGLALSSRNRYLTPEQRATAVALSAALQAGATAGREGADAVLAAAGQVLATAPTLVLDYLALTDPDLGPAPAAGPARLLVAARAGSTRLLDNAPLHLGDHR
ncbi:pantoate--beta-alanine ligase [Geodermatophilus ruber]|uniref:Pantothenate synthetase n=1 Tax=Geodermatophilus ruber TaxID=504800 RepID=A0A1I4D888_9ACTN|nr:pantoate--beta-alanine ligase [Geodermatophilus ruber]SFK88587.1 pantothenate synthetase [Geodermatophilus ruber]